MLASGYSLAPYALKEGRLSKLRNTLKGHTENAVLYIIGERRGDVVHCGEVLIISCQPGNAHLICIYGPVVDWSAMLTRAVDFPTYPDEVEPSPYVL